jgi:hypothetical protein
MNILGPFALIPIIVCWLAIFILCQELAARGLLIRDWRVNSLLSCTVWGTVLLAIVEFLSLIQGLDRYGLILGWLVAGLVFLALSLKLWRTRTEAPVASAPRAIVRQLFAIVQDLPPISQRDKVLFSGIGVVLLLLLLIGILTAPNTNDSMTYHLSRIMHWAQNGTVAHYPTHIVRQLFLNPWAEFAMLTLSVISNSDHVVASVQWFSLVGCLVGVSFLASRFSSHRGASILATLFVLSIPMGVMQSTSTQNDYVVAMWLVCLAAMIVLILIEGPNGLYILGAALALGLAILTKATAYLFAAPLIGWLLAGLLRQRLGWRLIVGQVLLPLMLIVFAINLGHFSRNFRLFHSPLGTNSELYVNQIFGVGPTTSNVIRNVSLHVATGSVPLTNSLNSTLAFLHDLTGQDINDRRTTFRCCDFEFIHFNRPLEGSVGNPVHLLGIILVGLYFLRPTIFRLNKMPVAYGLCLVAAFLLFSSILKWQPFHSRLLLSLFVLGAPLVGAMLAGVLPPRILFVIGACLIIYAGYWMVVNQIRPPTLDYFQWPREKQYFRGKLPQYSSYTELSDRIAATECRAIGLLFRGNTLEYPLWAMLQNRGHQAHLRHVYVTNNASSSLSDSNFEPCLIVRISRIPRYRIQRAEFKNYRALQEVKERLGNSLKTEIIVSPEIILWEVGPDLDFVQE